METKHIEKFGVRECEACYEIAKYKWNKDFVCKRPGCGYQEFSEGATPFSRLCKCGRDESVTAHTVFDKLRISKATQLSIVKELMKKKGRLKIEELTTILHDQGYADANIRSVWSLLNKIYARMSSPSFVYDESALFLLVFKKKQVFIFSKGKVSGQYRYNAQSISDGRHLGKFIKAHTSDQTWVAYFDAKNLNSMKAKIWRRRDFPKEAKVSISDDVALSIATKFHDWTDYIQPYLFKKNGGTYEQLMHILTKSVN